MSTTNSIDLGGLSKQYSARDLPSHQKLKYRDIGQAGPEEARKDKRDLRKDLDEREKVASSKESSSSKRLALTEKSSDRESEKSSGSKKLKTDQAIPVNLDADEVLPDDDDSDNEKSENDSDADDANDNEDDDDDDTEALMAELNRIKKERAAEATKLEAERKAREEKIRVENILKGNPLLNPSVSKVSADFKVKRRWDDDVVFKNCAKLDDGKKKEFINDTLRSEFHKKFMERYIKSGSRGKIVRLKTQAKLAP